MLRTYPFKKGFVFAFLLSTLVISIISTGGAPLSAPPTPTPVAPPPPQPASFTVTPSSIESTSKAIMPAGIIFKGAGWKPGKTVIVELIGKEEKVYALAAAEANEFGAFKAEVDSTTKLSVLLRVPWSKEVGGLPLMEKMKPLEPGVYTIRARGAESKAVVTVPFELLPPAKE